MRQKASKATNLPLFMVDLRLNVWRQVLDDRRLELLDVDLLGRRLCE